MNRFIVPACLLCLASLCGSAAGAEALQSADHSSTNSVIVESAPTMQSSRPIRDKGRKAARTTLAVVSAPVVVPVVVGAYLYADTLPRCVARVRSAFTWCRTPAAE